eukprot:s1241_g1.t2
MVTTMAKAYMDMLNIDNLMCVSCMVDVNEVAADLHLQGVEMSESMRQEVADHNAYISSSLEKIILLVNRAQVSACQLPMYVGDLDEEPIKMPEFEAELRTVLHEEDGHMISRRMTQSMFERDWRQWTKDNPALRVLGVSGYRSAIGGSWKDMITALGTVAPAPLSMSVLTHGDGELTTKHILQLGLRQLSFPVATMFDDVAAKVVWRVTKTYVTDLLSYRTELAQDPNVVAALWAQAEHIRAPIGWLFDSDCTVWTAPEEVYPPPAEMPAAIALLNNTPELPVYPWPNSATILSCRGDGHQALLTVRRGLREQRVYLFRIEIKQNPATTPISNTWSLTFGDESSGAMPGFPVWTFPGVRIEPVLLAWTNKNWLYYYNPVTTPLTDLPPILRIVMPAQYEFLVAADDQDMQGERCFLSMQQEGSCRLCGVPFQPSEAWCVREWNRKNAATIYFAQSKIIEPGFQYSVWVIVTNPHSPDALDGPRSTWVMETFFGRPVPPATIPEGYFLDYVVAPGYRVSGLSELTVETPEARDGGSFVDWVTFTMNFPDLLLPGDRILIRAPPGFQMSFLLPGFELVVLCYGFRWLPTIWPPPLPPDVDPDTIPQHLIPIRPPQRPPVPEGVPTWASGSSVLEIQPTNLSSELQWAADGAWVMRMPINFTAAILSDFQQFLLLIESNASNFSNLTANDYVVPNAVELMQRIGLPSWAVPAAARSQIQTQGNETVNASTEYLVLRSHCLDMFAQDAAGNYLNDDFNWSKVPLTADTQVWYDFHSYVFLNGSVVSSDAENFNYTNYTIEFNISQNVSEATNFSDFGFYVLEEIHLCFRATFEATRFEIDGTAAEEFCLSNCTISNRTQTECIVDCLFTPTARSQVRCTALPAGGLPDGAEDVSQQLLAKPDCAAQVQAFYDGAGMGQSRPQVNDSNGTNDSNSSNVSMGTPPTCLCGRPTEVQAAVLWRSKFNLTAEVEAYRREYEAAVRLRSLDASPLQAEAMCNDNQVEMHIQSTDLHPDPQFVNSTVTFRFEMRFINPRRPPLDFENNWIMLHSRPKDSTTSGSTDNEDILSSDAVQSWSVRSKLRYITINRLTEVLRPTDPAIIHFEFVTVNPADSMEIQAAFPIGFDFTNVYLNSIGTDDGNKPPNVGRRLLWQGFTSGIELRDGYRDTCELRVNFDKNEYVRFELGGILIPWTGGQALFNMHTSIGGFRQDEIELCCHEGEPPENPAHVFKVPYRLQGLRGVLMNEWMQQAFLYPIASSMKTRLGEEHLVSFTFMLASEIVLPPRASVIRVIVRAPLGYGIQLFEEEMDVRDSAFLIEDPTVQVGDGLRMRSIAFSLDFRASDATQIQLSLPGLMLMRTDIEYRIMFLAVTPGFNSMRIPGDLWVIEITDDYKQLTDQVSEQKGSLTDFELLSKVNFSCEATRAPPEVVIVLEVTLYELGEAFEYPNRVDVYAPAGYKFLLSCFAPGERQRLQFNFVSCRERWTLFQGNYLSGAILMAADAGVLPSDMPMKIRLQALTPPLTPAMNDFFVVTHQRQGDAAWGLTPSSFPVSNMQVTNRYTGVAGAEVPMFLAFTLRYPLAWGGNAGSRDERYTDFIQFESWLPPDPRNGFYLGKLML